MKKPHMLEAKGTKNWTSVSMQSPSFEILHALELENYNMMKNAPIRSYGRIFQNQANILIAIIVCKSRLFF